MVVVEEEEVVEVVVEEVEEGEWVEEWVEEVVLVVYLLVGCQNCVQPVKENPLVVSFIIVVHS